MINLNITGPQGTRGSSGSNLLGNSKWRMSPAEDNEDVYPIDGYFKFFQDGPSLQFAINEINSSSSNVLEFLTSSKTLLQSEGLIVTVVQNDDPSIYKSGLISAISSTYSYPVGSGNAAIIASLILNASGEFTSGKEYSILINVRGDLGAQGVQGNQGVQGVQGNQGHQGLQGHQGASGGPQGTQGLQGSQGSQGYQGVIGGQGIQGSQGAQGPQGLFGGPQGYQGVQGSQGHQGNPQGPQGFPGVGGAMGAQSPQGAQGYPGPQGVQGHQGTAGGPQGYQGVQGSQGTQGFQGMYGGPQGITGSTGNAGVQGVQGNQGVQGAQGIRGNQGFQGEPGFVGAQGTQGYQGTQGFQGNQGNQGNQGTQGVQGTQGTQGVQGSSVQGAQGSQGVQGTQGVQGFQGTQGNQGVQGDTNGPQGPQGVQGATGPGNGVNASYTGLGDSTVSLLLHMNGANNSTTFTDKSYSIKTATAYVDAKISTSDSKFGGASFYSPGTNGSRIDITDSTDFVLGTGDFTIETWFNLSALSVGTGGYYSTIFDTRASSNYGLFFAFNSSRKLVAYTLPGIFFTSTAAISTGTWYHLAIVRRSNTFSVYLNGTIDSSVDISGKNFTENNFVIGCNYDYSPFPGAAFNGYIDEFRVTKGLARYTANFTPETSAFADADVASNLPANPTLGQIIYSTDGFYVCSATSPVTWKKYSSTPVTIYP